MHPQNKTRKKSQPTWVLTLFALPFAAIGVGMLIFTVVPTLQEWARMKDWQSVEARVLGAELEVHRGDDSHTYEATATYSYKFGDQDYQSSRVAINKGSDNIGDFQENLGRRLESAAGGDIPIMVWVNPNNPAEAVIDRSLRVELLMFNMLFVVVFGGFGIGLLTFLVFFNSRPVLLETPETIDKPWLQKKDWAENRISCSQKSTLWFAWIFASFWNLISMPMLFFLPDEIASGNNLALIGLIFPAVGIGLLWWAIKVTRDWRRFGQVYLSLDPLPGSIGGQVGGFVEVPIKYLPHAKFAVTLNCIYSYVSGSGKNRSTREKLVWQVQGIAACKSANTGTRVQFLFDVPEGLPSSEPEELPYHSWRVDIECEDPSINFSRQFTIPVYATAQTSRYVREKSAEHPAAVEARLDHIEKISGLKQIPGGVELNFPLFRSWKMPLLGVIFGGIFVAVGIGIGLADGPFIFPLVFGSIGGLVVCACIDTLFNSRFIRLDAEGYFGRKWLFGILLTSRKVPRQQLKRLRLKESYSSQSSKELTIVYKIVLDTDEGKSLHVADSLEGEATARQMLEIIGFYTGIPAEEKIEVVGRKSLGAD